MELYGFRERPGRTEVRDAVRAILGSRKRDSHKGDHGRAALACGSDLYAGAALLATEAALRMGAGYTYLYSTADTVAAARVRLPEAICRVMPPASASFAEYIPYLSEASASLVGCGIGQEGDGAKFCRAMGDFLATRGGAVVLDADALNLLSRHGARELLRAAKRPVILTPHEMEFSRLCGLPLTDIKADRTGCAVRFAADTGVTVLLKGPGSVIARPDGSFSVCPSGSPALAKGGTGDVLAGMLLGLLAQGAEPSDAAFLSAYLHGEAGEEQARIYSERGVLPSTLAATAATVLCDIFSESNEQKGAL